MKLTRRVKRLEQTLPPPPVVDWQRQKRWHKVYKQWVGLCIEAQPLLGDDQDRVLTAILQAATEYTGPLATWFIHLHSGRLCTKMSFWQLGESAKDLAILHGWRTWFQSGPRAATSGIRFIHPPTHPSERISQGGTSGRAKT